MTERPIVQHWKCCVRETGPGVRIPPSPLAGQGAISSPCPVSVCGIMILSGCEHGCKQPGPSQLASRIRLGPLGPGVLLIEPSFDPAVTCLASLICRFLLGRPKLLTPFDCLLDLCGIGSYRLARQSGDQQDQASDHLKNWLRARTHQIQSCRRSGRELNGSDRRPSDDRVSIGARPK